MYQPAREWFNQSEYDLMTAKDMYNVGRYIYSVYMCHLAIEKALKALVAANIGKTPPKVHNLIQLAKLGAADLNKEQKDFLATLNTASITTRYPEELAISLKRFNRTMAREYLLKTEDVIKCIAQDPRLQA